MKLQLPAQAMKRKCIPREQADKDYPRLLVSFLSIANEIIMIYNKTITEPLILMSLRNPNVSKGTK